MSDDPIAEDTQEDVSSDTMPSASELGAMLSQKVRRITKPCLQCGRPMTNVTVRREFCSPRCRQKHWLRRLNSLAPGEPMIYVRRQKGGAPHDESTPPDRDTD